MSTLLTAHKVSLNIGGKTILDKVSLSIKSNDFITLIGPNGAGKSMLLKCLLGLHKPDSGMIKKHGQLNIGYVPQQIVLDKNMPLTVRRFLLLRQNNQVQSRLPALAQETDIESLLDKPLASLSGGELQRVLLARALISEPQLLIMDEPAQNLDISGQLAFYRLLEGVYKQRKIALLMVSHDLHMVMASTQQVVCLYHHICCSGEPLAVTKDPEFTKLFGNDMAKMMAVYQHNHQHCTDHTHD